MTGIDTRHRDLSVVVADAIARFNAMSIADQEAMMKAQRESFMRGMTTPCEHGVLDFETCPQCRTTPTGGEG